LEVEVAVFTIPVRADLAIHAFQTELDGAVYELGLIYNSREGFWYLTVRDEAGNDIRSGLKIATGTFLLRLVRDLRRPPGDIHPLDTTGQGLEAGQDELGEEVLLTYLDEAELS
jgi:hypothetical protein